MNALEQYALENVIGPKYSELQLMNLLQRAGVVSDNCVWLYEVAEADHKKAIKWIAQNIN